MPKKSILSTLERKSILILGDFVIAGFSLKNFVYNAIDYQGRGSQETELTIFFLGFLSYAMMGYVLDHYNIEKITDSKIVPRVRSASVTFGFAILLIIITTILFDFAYWRIHLLIFMFFFPLQILIWRELFNYIFKFVPTTKNVLYLYDESTSDSIQNNIELINGIDKKTYYNVVEYVMNLDEISSNGKDLNELHNVDSWIINTRNYDNFSESLERNLVNTILSGNEVITYTSFYETVYEALPITSHNDSIYEILQLKNTKIRYIQSIVSFNFNLILSIVTGAIFFSVVPFVFILNLFFNRGPLFYTQLRVGKYGKEYKIFKFRSMVVDAESKGAQMAKKNDARITAFGKILRKFRIDELPQILSVIRGDMVFIGPRPERKVFVDKLNEVTPFYNVRHLVKPGITGWAQVKYKYGENLQDSIRKLEYDLYYIKNKSVSLDIRIIFKTMTTILFSRGV
ncbi:sugar transferase [Croceivirga lutea]|uniref:sugar transferase n=1 Tax=Croceivirga lutea TaxID=1775167 RepID=UPI00163A9311|nr:sugar transferase [Croceivirga lutea]GGG42578.1 sugar transferase [Croceivirga lutea]